MSFCRSFNAFVGFIGCRAVAQARDVGWGARWIERERESSGPENCSGAPTWHSKMMGTTLGSVVLLARMSELKSEIWGNSF